MGVGMNAKVLRLPTLLVITDSPTILYWVKKHLDDEFFIVDAKTREKAMGTVRTAALNFIILDSAIEDCSPIELCHEIRSQLINEHTPIFLITGRLKKTYRDKAKKAGVTDFLSAELDIDELRSRIEAGRKSATIRDKTKTVSKALKGIKAGPNSDYLKSKKLIPNQAVRMLEKAKKAKAEVILLVVRLDRYEEMERKYGPAILQKLQEGLSAFLKGYIKKSDLVIPSENQILLLLKNTTKANGRILAKSIQEDIKEELIQFPELITVSIAVGSLSTDSEGQLNELVNSAIKALEPCKDKIISIDEDKS